VRTTIVSTSKLREYRRFIFVLDGFVMLLLIGFLLYTYSTGAKWTNYVFPIVIYLQAHIYYGLFLNLKDVSYDEGSSYYNEDNYEVQVPFEEIRSIELQSITGIYSIKLLHRSQGRTEIYFKASLWYPFNFHKKDEIVEELRNKIDRYKSTLPEKNVSALPSYRL
jgi:hypothetical protein